MRPYLFCLILMGFSCLLWSQATEDLMGDVDLDGLFEEDSAFQDVTEPAPSSESESIPVEDGSEEKAPVNLLEDVVGKSEFTLGGNFRFVAGYSSGWTYMPWEAQVGSNGGMEDMALLDMRSTLTLDFRISPQFRVLQKYAMSFPDFETTVSEFFGDYTIKDRVYVRIGRQNLTWGASRFFPFTNLTARVPDHFGDSTVSDDISDADSYAVKVDVPIAVGGIQGLAFTRNGYFEDPDAPSSDEIGYGGNFNLAGTLGDFTLGTFYHKDLNWRSFYSLSTTLFGCIEVYQEGIASYDIQNDDVQPDYADNFMEIDQTYQYPIAKEEYEAEAPLSDRLDFGANLGFYWELFEKKLKLSGEYFYCGEETELDLKNSRFPLLWGHNMAGGVSLNLWDQLRLFSEVRYNRTARSGIFVPGMAWDVLPQMTLNFAAPLIWGSTSRGYYRENPDELDRPASFILTCVISGKM